MFKTIGLVATLAVASLPAAAHFVWLERDGNGPARVYFGEWANDQREKTGARLDSIKSPVVFQADRARPAALTREADHIAAAITAPGDVRLVEEGLAPRADRDAGGKSKTVFNARAGRTETKGALDLELVPTADGGNTFTLLFRGTPVPRAEVTVFGPPKWTKSHRTDANGQITIATPWAGFYVLEAAHQDDKAGGSGEGAYDRVKLVTTLTFVAENGIPWPAK
jgi:uncharacterized GH25 family protein